MAQRPAGCPFCGAQQAFLRNGLAYVVEDKFPVAPGHSLIIPHRHVSDFFQTTKEERDAMLELVLGTRALLERKHHPDGYNLGINVGEAAGQTIYHVHLHLIPRYTGDVANPRGGVRGVIPARQQY